MSGLSNLASAMTERVKTNLGNSFSSMSAQQWIRLIAVVGAYLLARPYLVKLAGRAQAKQLEQAEAQEAAEEAEQRARISPNELRGQAIGVPVDTDSEDDGGDKKPALAEWGKKARRRQRNVMRKMLEEHEKRLADAEGDEEDKDIQEFLVD